ncbi:MULTISPECIES: APC family permease [unclassified Streptomyces]|uniref:APC family permease n=1 Tax=unclassified Streptomyces TaxID=2593676 RepID=UPI002475B4D3|nr:MULTISPECIES: APC family permease [unclassified Streptomyces]MDH6454812.1 amino acid transporter [Streptomyces sp. SAI-119]MDH6494632.1 amino acid transporter [Streptomyces sp. SAI-149]
MSSRPPLSSVPSSDLRRSLGVVDGVAIAASSTAATTSIAIGMGTIATIVGLQAPALLLLAFLPVLGIATAYARLNRSEPNCGNGYVWVGKSLGPWPGFLTGWVTLVGSVIFCAYTSAIMGSVVLAFANKAGLHSVAGIALDPTSTGVATAVGLVILTALTALAVTGVRSATRFQFALLVFEYTVLLAFCGWALITGDHAVSLSWFNPFEISSGTAFAQGMVLAVFFFWGWDAAFSVNEETKSPGDAARGGLIALFAMLGLFLFASVAFQREMSLAELVRNGPQALPYLGEKLAAEPWATLPLIALMFSAVASVQATLIPTARGLFAMSRDRTMGPVWTRVHTRYGTPAAGTVVIMTIAAVIAVLAVAIPKLSDMLLAAVNAIGLIVALYYGLTALACAVRFRSARHDGPREALLAIGVPAVSGLILLGLGGYLGYSYLTMSDHFELSPDNGWFMFSLPAVIVLAGLVMAAVAKYVRHSPYFTTGRGTDAESLTLPMDRTAV